jgi:hypothetical protein
MTATTATVETLTAEVRVLQVGNRQITLSVARQLDAFELQWEDEALNFTPFGRIKTGAKGERYVPCEPNDKGAERVQRPGGNCGRPSCGHIKLWIGNAPACGTHQRLAACEFHYQWIGRHQPTGSLIVVNAFADEVPAEFADWRELPLIVLAGLR